MEQAEKSALVEQLLANDHHMVKFENAKILSSTLHYPTRLHREAIEIFKHKDNLNREGEALRLNQACVQHCGILASLSRVPALTTPLVETILNQIGLSC